MLLLFFNKQFLGLNQPIESTFYFSDIGIAQISKINEFAKQMFSQQKNHHHFKIANLQQIEIIFWEKTRNLVRFLFHFIQTAYIIYNQTLEMSRRQGTKRKYFQVSDCYPRNHFTVYSVSVDQNSIKKQNMILQAKLKPQLFIQIEVHNCPKKTQDHENNSWEIKTPKSHSESLFDLFEQSFEYFQQENQEVNYYEEDQNYTN